MEIFEGDDSTKEDGSFLCNGEFGLNCGVASKIPWVCVCIDSQYVVGDPASGECVESDVIFILGSLFLSMFKRRESLSLLGLLSNVLVCPGRNSQRVAQSYPQNLTLKVESMVAIKQFSNNGNR